MTLLKVGRHTNAYIFILFKKQSKITSTDDQENRMDKEAKLFTYTFFVVFTLELYKYFI